MEYFSHEVISDRLIRIIDVTGVCCYLAIGSRRACLLDTCSGLGNIKEYAEALTDKPLFVILTHGHLDHMGGAGLFDEVYMHSSDVPVLEKHGDMTFRVEDTNKMLNLEPPLSEADFVPTLSTPTRPLADGDTFDLGDLTIRMIAVPGHTAGMMCPLLVEDRTIIFGDACGVAVLLFDEFSSCVSEYRESLHRLKQHEQEYDHVYRNHGTFWSPKNLLDHVIECCELILNGQDDRDPISVHGCDLFAAKKVTAHGKRVDGKEGNLFYSSDKAI